MLDGRARLTLSDFPDLLKPGGAASVLPTGARDRVFVLAIGDGQFAAVSSRCTHRGCTIDVTGQQLVCPCHGSTYTRGGTVLRGPAEEPLRAFPTVVTSDGAIEIRLGGA